MALMLNLESATLWQLFLLLITLSAAATASGHAVIYKRDSRSALVWVSFIWFVPLLGSFLYFVLGINRIKRAAGLLRAHAMAFPQNACVRPCPPHRISQRMDSHPSEPDLCALAHTIGKVTNRPLLPGNRITPLLNGDQAFPRMHEAIKRARSSIALSSYIFDLDPTGARFAFELSQAQARGVQVRVIIDATGARYSWPPITERLGRLRIPHAHFFPKSKLSRPLTLNLHNHRKLMIVDGQIGFTGGMNIRHSNVLKNQPRRPVQDIHFELRGPVVGHLQSTFAEDWAFATGERIEGDAWFPPLRRAGKVLARGITDGPDEDLDIMIWTIIAAVNAAKSRIRIVTPYFLPESQIIAALNAAALRGVEVQILLPEKNNLPFMTWATSAMLWQILTRGCHVFFTPTPFDHSKLMTVDRCWSLIGSANWDARSLRLNFEFNVECYSTELASFLDQHIDAKLVNARSASPEALKRRPLPIKLRDGMTRLLSPFL